MEYINPTNPSQNFQTVDNLNIRQNYGPINHAHHPFQIYHDKNSKIRVFPTIKQLRNLKDACVNYDDRANIGSEMTRYLRESESSGVRSGWRGYETEPEREILSYDIAVKSLNNIRFSVDPEISIFEDIKSFFTRFCEEGMVVDTASLATFEDLEGVFVDKEFHRQKMLESPANFISELRYNIAHGYDTANQSASRTSLPISIYNSESSSRTDQTNHDETSLLACLNSANDLNDKLVAEVFNLQDQISELKESVFFKDSSIDELMSVVSAVLEVNKQSLAKNDCNQADILVLDRIFNFKSGIRSQIYKFKENRLTDKKMCGCYQCELQQVCTRSQKIIELGLENLCLDPKVFVFGNNIDGHVCESTDDNPQNIELTEITCSNKIGSKNVKVPEEKLSVSLNISSHNSRDNNCRQIIIDNKQSTPVKAAEHRPRILVLAENDDTIDITRPENPGSDDSNAIQWSEVVSAHEDFMDEN